MRMPIPTSAWAALTWAMAAVGVAAVSGAVADEYPARTIRLIVPFAPGGGNDTLARIFGQKMAYSFGKPVVIENRPGAGATIASGLVAPSDPDGYTLLMSSIASHAVSPLLYRSVAYDPIKDFSPIA